jgi:hypothetical protein
MNDTDDRLVEAMREYQAALDAGRAPLKREFLSRYPDIASELSECLGGLDFLRSAAPGLRSASCARSAGAAWAWSTRPSRSAWAGAWR